jgi:hypothetical protein
MSDKEVKKAFNELERSKFEEWYAPDKQDKPAIKRGSSGEYTFIGAVNAWKAWQAAVESVKDRLAS